MENSQFRKRVSIDYSIPNYAISSNLNPNNRPGWVQPPETRNSLPQSYGSFMKYASSVLEIQHESQQDERSNFEPIYEESELVDPSNSLLKTYQELSEKYQPMHVLQDSIVRSKLHSKNQAINILFGFFTFKLLTVQSECMQMITQAPRISSDHYQKYNQNDFILESNLIQTLNIAHGKPTNNNDRRTQNLSADKQITFSEKVKKKLSKDSCQTETVNSRKSYQSQLTSLQNKSQASSTDKPYSLNVPNINSWESYHDIPTRRKIYQKQQTESSVIRSDEQEMINVSESLKMNLNSFQRNYLTVLTNLFELPIISEVKRSDKGSYEYEKMDKIYQLKEDKLRDQKADEIIGLSFPSTLKIEIEQSITLGEVFAPKHERTDETFNPKKVQSRFQNNEYQNFRPERKAKRKQFTNELVKNNNAIENYYFKSNGKKNKVRFQQGSQRQDLKVNKVSSNPSLLKGMTNNLQTQQPMQMNPSQIKPLTQRSKVNFVKDSNSNNFQHRLNSSRMSRLNFGGLKSASPQIHQFSKSPSRIMKNTNVKFSTGNRDEFTQPASTISNPMTNQPGSIILPTSSLNENSNIQQPRVSFHGQSHSQERNSQLATFKASSMSNKKFMTGMQGQQQPVNQSPRNLSPKQSKMINHLFSESPGVSLLSNRTHQIQNNQRLNVHLNTQNPSSIGPLLNSPISKVINFQSTVERPNTHKPKSLDNRDILYGQSSERGQLGHPRNSMKEPKLQSRNQKNQYQMFQFKTQQQSSSQANNLGLESKNSREKRQIIGSSSNSRRPKSMSSKIFITLRK